MTYANQYEEHIAHSTQCNSQWDGFDRGTDWSDEEEQTERCIGRMTSEAGYKVVIAETSFRDSSDLFYTVVVNGKEMFSEYNNRQRAIRVARWWVDGCPG